MWKPIAAGLMCLGFVTLGVAISAGDDEERTDNADVIAEGAKEKPAEAAAAKAEPARVVEIRIGEDGNAGVIENEPKKEGATSEGVEVIIQNDAGKTLRTIRSHPLAYRAAARFHIDPAAIDPETRQ